MACETSSDRLVSGLKRITVLPGNQIGDGGFKVGAVEVGLCERRAEPAIAVDDDIAIFGRTRNNRGPFTHTQLPLSGLSYTGRDGFGTGVCAKQPIRNLSQGGEPPLRCARLAIHRKL